MKKLTLMKKPTLSFRYIIEYWAENSKREFGLISPCYLKLKGWKNEENSCGHYAG